MQQSLAESAAEEIRAWIARRQLSGNKVARSLDVSPSWLSQRLLGRQDIGLDELVGIAGVLDVPVMSLIGGWLDTEAKTKAGHARAA
jgi:transcriptional regulator with XRE-family HTH domain